MILVGGIQKKKPFIRFAHLRALFFLLLLNASIQRNVKTKPGPPYG
jgi:hypothetical protein